MTIATTTNKIVYTGTGSTVAFPYNFKILANTDLVVTEVLIASPYTETVKTLTTHYTVSGVGEAGGGTVTMLVAPAATVKLVIQRTILLNQEFDLVENDNAPAESFETAFDKLTMISQQIDEKANRSIKQSITETGGDYTLPPVSAGKIIGWNSGGTDLTNYDNPDTASADAIAAAAAAVISAAAASSSSSSASGSSAAALVSANAAAASAASAASALLGTANITHRQDITTNNTVANQVVRMGWGYIQGDATSDITKAIVFGNTFANIPLVFVNYVGKINAVPTALSDFGAPYAGCVSAISHSISTTGFTIYMIAETGATSFPNTDYFGFTWIAIGTL